MFTYIPSNWNGLCLIADQRLPSDTEEDQPNGVCVFQHWAFGKAALGREWPNTARIALYDHGVNPWKNMTKKEAAEERKNRRNTLLNHLSQMRPKCILLLQSASRADEDSPFHGTMCWDAFGPPDSLKAMQGTCWSTPYGPVVPLLNPFSYEYVYGWLIRRWMRMGLQLAQGTMARLECTKIYATPSAELPSIIDQIRATKLVAVDIESYSPKNLLTAVGLSNGDLAVSVPWDPFYPFGSDTLEPGYAESSLLPAYAAVRTALRDLLAEPSVTKVFHNKSYDIPFLAEKGLPVGGTCHDTMGMHREAYRQFRHALQIACATEMCIPPWKSLYKEPGFKKDDPNFWIVNPLKLRKYNCQDAFFTWHLAQALAWKVEVEL